VEGWGQAPCWIKQFQTFVGWDDVLLLSDEGIKKINVSPPSSKRPSTDKSSMPTISQETLNGSKEPSELRGLTMTEMRANRKITFGACSEEDKSRLTNQRRRWFFLVQFAQAQGTDSGP
jgi:hypothetical protein